MQATQAVAGVQYAGFWTRFAAYLIDSVIVAIVLGIVAAVLIPVIGVVSIVMVLALGLAYFIGMWAVKGQTLGKMVMGVRIIKTDGTPVTFGTAVLRYIGYLVSSIILDIGFLMIAWDSKKQGLHDKIAGTYVVKV